MCPKWRSNLLIEYLSISMINRFLWNFAGLSACYSSVWIGQSVGTSLSLCTRRHRNAEINHVFLIKGIRPNWPPHVPGRANAWPTNRRTDSTYWGDALAHVKKSFVYSCVFYKKRNRQQFPPAFDVSSASILSENNLLFDNIPLPASYHLWMLSFYRKNFI